ncbi:MAG: DUF3500 domain-containing protein [Acidobacteria bacterium]|nr:DUF3500 domain-containing protein [Acidobacteriota bacterium]
MKTRLFLAACFALLIGAALQHTAFSQRPAGKKGGPPDFKAMSARAESEGLAKPYSGIFTSAGPEKDLFPVRSTGVSTEPVREAALAFLDVLSPEQLAKTTYPVDDDEWRKWMNQHFYVRQGVSFKEMTDAQREAAFALMKASLSARGFALSRDIMRLNYTLGEIQNDFEQYGEWLYNITVMGEPSKDQPWGWQVDGHHLIVNYFVLGDQVVMTPTFVGSEPVVAESGKYEGVAILQDEQNLGLALLNKLKPAQKAKAVIEISKTGNNNLGEAFHDNFQLDYAGLPVREMDAAQKEALLELTARYVDLMDDGHAKVKMDEVRARLDDTYFAWIGEGGPDSVFYYRIHSPVLLIEFDHQNPVGLRPLYPGVRSPIRQHVHVVIRTPNGNDYGKDLLRQHYARSHRSE